MWKKSLEFWARRQTPITLIFLVLSILFPLVFPQRYIVSIGVMCGIYVLLSLSMNLITGYLGIVVLGQAAFYGIGAYTAAILSTRLGWGFLPNLLAAALLCALAGIIISSPALRLKGSYLSIVTLGFCEIIRIVELNWIGLTRGPYGITSIPPPALFGFQISSIRGYYYLILAMCCLAAILIANLTNSRIGRSFAAIKGDEVAAQSMGINIFRTKLIGFAISAAIAGTAGAFYAQYMSYVDSTTFTADQSFQILGMTILGGLGNIPGSVLGAISMTVLPELLRGVAEYRQIIYGLIIAIMVIVKPEGILGGFRLKQIRQFKQHQTRRDS